MSLPDRTLPPPAVVQEDTLECLSRTLAHVLEQMTPTARLRLVAFMHLVEDPEALRASLKIDPSGRLCLTLDTLVAPARSHQH